MGCFFNKISILSFISQVFSISNFRLLKSTYRNHFLIHSRSCRFFHDCSRRKIFLDIVPLKIIVDVDECKYNNRCVNSKGCINQVGDFLCICQDGWTGKLCDQSKFF